MEKRKSEFKVSILFVIIIVIILSPYFNRIFNVYSPGKLDEKRRKVTIPQFNILSMKSYLDQYTKFFENKYDFRTFFIKINSLLKIKLFNISPVDRIMLGKKGWLFIKKLRENERVIDYSISIKMFRRDELEFWGKIFEERRIWLRQAGIKMFVVIVPNKSTIYPEYLRDRIKRVTSQVRTNQLVNYFRYNTGVVVLDLRKVLITEKKNGLLYYKTDSHWNWRGAYIGYREIIKYLSKFYPDSRVKNFDFFIRKKISFPRGGDLASMLSLQKSIYREPFYRLFAGKEVEINKTGLSWFKRKKVDVLVTRNSSGLLPKTLMIHDSFGNRLRRLLSIHFSEIIYLRDWGFNMFPEVIRREKPKIVIFEIAERFLHNFKLKNPAEISTIEINKTRN